MRPRSAASGSDVTVISYLSMVHRCLDAVAESGVDGEVIDLRWLDRASLDWDTIEASIKKTNKVLIVEQGSLQTSYGGWLADEIAAPLLRLARRAGRAGARQRVVAEHLQGAGGGRPGQYQRHRRRAAQHLIPDIDLNAPPLSDITEGP